MWQVVGGPYPNTWPHIHLHMGINELLITIVIIENQKGWRKLVIDDKIKYRIFMHKNFKE